MSEHTLTRRVKLAADVPKHGMLSTLVTHARDLAVLEQLVEYPPVGSIEVVFACNALLPHVLICFGRVDFFPRHIQVAGQNDALACLGKISDASLQGGKETVAEIVSQAIAVGRTVDTKEHKGGKLEHETAALSVERGWVNAQGSHLGGRRITANASVVWQVSVCS